MSPEINGNPPSATKRKKNHKKSQEAPKQTPPIDINMSHCNYFSPNNVSIPDINAYYSFLNYANPSEPMSLPIYPVNYPNCYPNPNFNYMSSPKSMGPPAGPNGDTTEYLSLPVGCLDQNDDLSKRRYSDPGLPNDSDDSGNSIESKIIESLSKQVTSLKESNRKLNRDVMEMRMELNLLKQQQNSRHYEREYEPGMLADIIREVRDAARVREDALLARVKHMIEEKQLSLNHLHLVNEKNRNNDRILKLEDQLKNMSMSSFRSEEAADQAGDTAARQVLELEREALELRRELQDTRAKKEEADQKLQQLDKKLATILRRNDIGGGGGASDDNRTMSSSDSMSVTTTSSISQPPPIPIRVTLSGPVTDL